jgi:membrane associated rhomboid family serine protease
MMFEVLSIQKSIFFAGLIGAVVSIAFTRKLTAVGAFFSIFGGTACAVYIAPIVMDYFNFKDVPENAGAFITGVIGMNFIGVLFNLVGRMNPNLKKTETGDIK